MFHILKYILGLPGTSVITVLHFYHILLNFDSKYYCFWMVFFMVLLFGKHSFGFPVTGKVFFGSFRNTKLS